MRHKMLLKNLLTAILILSLPACSSNTASDSKEESKKRELINTYVSTAGIYLKRGQLHFAKEKLDKALALDSGDVNANNVMALYQWKIEKFEEADRHFRRALDRDSGNPETLNNYGVFLCETNKIEDSVKMFDRAVVNPLYSAKVQAYVNAGRCLEKTKEYKRAEKYYLHALEIKPDFYAALLQMARLHAHTGKLNSAKKYIGAYFSNGPKTSETVYLAMRIEEALGNDRSASRYAKELLSRFPQSKESSWVKRRLKRQR